MGAEFITFDNAVIAMVRIIRRCGFFWLYSKLFYIIFIICGLSAVRIIGRKLRYITKEYYFPIFVTFEITRNIPSRKNIN